MIKLLVGLGNPGPEYERTRHNVGFWWIDELARRLRATWQLDRGHQGLIARSHLREHILWLLEPQTFMNRSGQSVASLARFYKFAPNEILVVHDELDLPPGEARLKSGGGHAGHNGLRDIHAQLGSADYWRLRIGIGHPGHKNEVANWVLNKPSPDDRIAVDQSIERSLSALDHLINGDISKATGLIHTSKAPRPKPAKPRPPKADQPTTAADPDVV